MQGRMPGNAPEHAPHRGPKAPFYLTGQVGGQPFSVHAEGERVILTRAQGERQEVDLVPPAPASLTSPASPASTVAELPLPVCTVGEVTGLREAGEHADLTPGV